MTRKTNPTLIFISVPIFVFAALLYFGPPSGTDTKVWVLSSLAAVSSVTAAVSSLWNTLSSSRNAAQLEELKQQLAVKLPALKESKSAALKYYRVLANLETKNWVDEDYKKAEGLMSDAESSVYLLSEEYQNAWYDYWQEARNICFEVKDQSKDIAKQYWVQTGAKSLAKKLEKINSLAMQY
ncbi:MAG: hypothetical protein IM466_07080 [Microcystis sp. M04BS1]|jgi:hypothetical protein|uniref:hypothetical protein n=1 Tax=Microcystis TaxID=1125 RepID=UPI001197C441|nr:MULTISPECIES: hypothetical protein [Microcystis]MCA2553499.1 hypothetical protein [Microcystis sp. M04BS1]MCU7243783.1 hypothetical protein [Microcystis aeruginosa WS75]NCR38876.1 hypothetical protein [Microcystis aeruginosa W13-11]NCR57745.1 hypothetical protein [Microcystis aeruginosa LL13-06]NCS20615.1 hypothetical protein [Microcystis aeruginosa G11-06]NCS48806.1 hypothetical protein [Microcystis aeruginosa BK11-02]TRU28215.1 MAG: hypothetical protein EWV79_02805 [Microcystis aerugino